MTYYTWSPFSMPLMVFDNRCYFWKMSQLSKTLSITSLESVHSLLLCLVVLVVFFRSLQYHICFKFMFTLLKRTQSSQVRCLCKWAMSADKINIQNTHKKIKRGKAHSTWTNYNTCEIYHAILTFIVPINCTSHKLSIHKADRKFW